MLVSWQCRLNTTWFRVRRNLVRVKGTYKVQVQAAVRETNVRRVRRGGGSELDAVSKVMESMDTNTICKVNRQALGLVAPCTA